MLKQGALDANNELSQNPLQRTSDDTRFGYLENKNKKCATNNKNKLSSNIKV